MYNLYTAISILGFTFIFSAIVGLVFFILKGIALYKMAKNRNMLYPWLGFIPFANNLLLGKLNVRIKEDGKKTKDFGVLLLILNILLTILSVIFINSFFLGMTHSIINQYTDHNSLIVLGGSMILLLPISILTVIFSCITYYNIFKIYSPDNAVLWLILTIFINQSAPIIIFCLRDKIPYISPIGYNPNMQNNNQYNYNYNPYIKENNMQHTHNEINTVSNENLSVDITNTADKKDDPIL